MFKVTKVGTRELAVVELNIEKLKIYLDNNTKSFIKDITKYSTTFNVRLKETLLETLILEQVTLLDIEDNIPYKLVLNINGDKILYNVVKYNNDKLDKGLDIEKTML